MKQDIESIIEMICLEDPRYHEDAYEFLLEALHFAQRKYKRKSHVSGKELLEGIKEMVMRRFGPLGIAVLKYWGIKSTEDFGNLVFNLISKKLLSKTEEDCLDDFKNVYDFDRVFNQVYTRRVNKDISRMR